MGEVNIGRTFKKTVGIQTCGASGSPLAGIDNSVSRPEIFVSLHKKIAARYSNHKNKKTNTLRVKRYLPFNLIR